MKTVVIGGYGNFGAHIAAKLVREGICEVIVAGRDGRKASEFADALGCDGAGIDTRSPELAARLAALRPDVVISTAGPFQGQDYRVARASLAAGAHYIDIADGREFVCGIAQLDAHARACGRVAIAGASSVPALSSAVVDRYAGEFARIDAIDIGISTAQRPPGLATTRAVLGYAGMRIPGWREAAAIDARGWQGLRRHTFAAPIGTRWLCDCDVPELELFPTRYTGVREVRFGAGVELAAVQWGLWALAWAVRARLVPDLSRWATTLHAASRELERFGSGGSAMFVELRGVDASGSARRRCWELIAGGWAGAQVPAMAAVALARRLAAGQSPRAGAMACVGLLSLEQYLAELSGLDVVVREAL